MPPQMFVGLEERYRAAVPVLTILRQSFMNKQWSSDKGALTGRSAGQKNIYCCGWNVRNAATLFQYDVVPALTILSFLWVIWGVEATEYV